MESDGAWIEGGGKCMMDTFSVLCGLTPGLRGGLRGGLSPSLFNNDFKGHET